MTSIVAWAGVDTRGVASVYIGSDSRISWGNNLFWDQGRKVFACTVKPDIFGYWGDVLFPALAIPVLVERIDKAGRSPSGASIVNVEQAIRRLWRDYPLKEQRDIGIIHAARHGDGMTSKFAISIYTYSASTRGWKATQVTMPDSSSLLKVAGSGAAAVRVAHDLWQASSARNTSRAVFSAFCEALRVGVDQNSGGPPQLVGIYRVAAGRMYGIIYNGQRYFAGSHLPGNEIPEGVEWRNDLFERVDGHKKQRLIGAQPHGPR
ncbi:hypothetical protein ACFYMB_05220 [Micromonospora haikouensis]|uniref:hypothetical protein n=1 Tax=Micromonospora TaxID=1873 RepID=UPI00369E4B89